MIKNISFLVSLCCLHSTQYASYKCKDIKPLTEKKKNQLEEKRNERNPLVFMCNLLRM